MAKIKSSSARKEPTDDLAADVEALMSALGANAGARQSPIYQWLDFRHDLLRPLLENIRIDWTAFAAHLTQIGLIDGKGAPPSPTVARTTWGRVRRARELTRTPPAPATVSKTFKVAPPNATKDTTTASGSVTRAVSHAPADNVYPPGIRPLSAGRDLLEEMGTEISDNPR